ncbi:hypothetical protein Bca52824_031000 [Brassica carinata]|uniref:Uncharacterized protein n=1 Tax=Brassica carinata TaxID=52824 RepID=A0A8X7SE98_BRACI|nr:hypothetical protein Bca52824_031000 [Brassica carinata]
MFIRSAKITRKKVTSGLISSTPLNATLLFPTAAFTKENCARGEDIESDGGSLFLLDCSLLAAVTLLAHTWLRHLDDMAY